ncbi:MAG: glycosyltransferase family 2 protein [Christensenellales bacterium]|jgi:glycosyltransferase involved in cell wall biosynthesis
MQKALISVIVPMYNEQEVIAETYRRLTAVMRGMGDDYELVFINDGSRDKTMEIMRGIQSGDSHVKIVDFARNFGHQVAVSAGMDFCRGDCAVIIDADLQDPPEMIPDMVAKWREGFEVVYGKRVSREGESRFKLFTAWLYYRVLGKLTGDAIPKDTGDFRLIDRQIIDIMGAMPEKSRFLRGMVAWIGFNQTPLEYRRDERWAGETKYPLKKMLKLASDGIMSFSYKPLSWATMAGMIVGAFFSLYLLAAFIIWCVTQNVPGYHFLIALLGAVQGLTLVMLGLQGAYIGRIFEQSKDRPLYIVRDTYGMDDAKD